MMEANAGVARWFFKLDGEAWGGLEHVYYNKNDLVPALHHAFSYDEVTRRSLLSQGAACLPVYVARGFAFGYDRKGIPIPVTVLSPPIEPGITLRSAPIELAGDWGRMLPDAANHVVQRMRGSCLDGVQLVSDRQPTRLRIDEHTSGSPAVWLHPDGSSTAWIIVDVGERAWSQLAYQFGHELGHVLANSWQAHAEPRAPCQWLEEAIVEAFSLRGLGHLASSWKQTPPFAGDNAYGDAVFTYRQNIIEHYRAVAREQGTILDFRASFERRRGDIEAEGDLNPFAQAASLIILAEYERAPKCIDAVGALNRWPGRSGVPIADYLHAWEASCVELQAPVALPANLRRMLGIA